MANRKLIVNLAIIQLITVTLVAVGSAQAQSYLSPYSCDSNRLYKCQQDMLSDLHSASINSDSIQYPISGPPYSPSQQKLLLSSSVCRTVRSNLNCILAFTPACYERDIPMAKNTDLILRAKRFLEEQNCNSPDISWRTSACYRSQELRLCEERYDLAIRSYFDSRLSEKSCQDYDSFRRCVDNYLTMNCKVHEADMANEYLIDKANELAWRCPPNSTDRLSNYLSSYTLNNPSGSVLSPLNYNNYGSLEQRPIPSYMGGGSLRELAWEKFRNPLHEEARLIDGRYPVYGTLGPVSDRLREEASECLIKTAPYVRECENTLLDNQRLASDVRDPNEIMQRTCCPLFQYRDCLARAVFDRCIDSGVTAVDLLMGHRKRELDLTCRSRTRETCSGSIPMAIINLPLILIFTKLSTLLLLRNS